MDNMGEEAEAVGEGRRGLSDIRVLPLRARPELAPVLVSWAYFEWSVAMRRNWSATLERYDPTRAEALPQTFVATVDDVPAGMASLRDRDSYDFLPGTTPWLCNVYVHPAMRRAGIAAALCQKLIGVAAGMGFAQIFLASSLKEGSLYHRIGFREVAVVEYFGPKYILARPLARDRAAGGSQGA
jgi:GNAT superfamily N-acetyltransferase